MLIETLGRETARYAIDRFKSVFTASGTDPRVIILGNQKSGTTAVARLLALSTGSTLTSDFVGSMYPFRLRPLTRVSCERLVRANRHAFTSEVVKEPNLTFLASDLVALFPNTAFVVVQRDPLDNIRSILDRVGWRPTSEEPFPPLAAMPNLAWYSILRGTDLEIRDKSSLEVLARRCQLAYDATSAIADNAFTLRYTDFLADRVGQIARLARLCGLESRIDITDVAGKAYSAVGANRGIDPNMYFSPDEVAIIRNHCASGLQE